MFDHSIAVVLAPFSEKWAMADEAKPRKIKRRRGNTLERWEVEIVKAMIHRGGDFTNDQDILAYFTRPTRSINHRLIRSEEHTSELQSLMRISSAVFCLKKK